MLPLFITGTNTDIGKTFVSCGIAREMKNRGIDVGVFKPFCSGSREDAELLIKASGCDDDIETVNPIYFKKPLAPYHAAKLNGNPTFDISKCFENFSILKQKHELLIVEGAGGILVPICEIDGEIYSFLNFFSDLVGKVIIVASRDLGTINHSWLSVNACKEKGLDVIGMIFNDTKPAEKIEPYLSNPEIIEKCAETTNLGEIDFNPEPKTDIWKKIVDKILTEKIVD